jgi:hypothetical protein
LTGIKEAIEEFRIATGGGSVCEERLTEWTNEDAGDAKLRPSLGFERVVERRCR